MTHSKGERCNMNVLLKHLRVAFEYALPERVIQTLRKSDCIVKKKYNMSLRSSMMSNSCYYNLFRKLSKDYSIEEIENMYLDMKARCVHNMNVPAGLFQLLLDFNGRVLDVNSGIPICKRDKLLDWRSISFSLGQDIFTTSLLAYHSVVNNFYPNSFDWPSQIDSNDLRLRALLKEGIAENHFHLGGSTQLFSLSWVALMNHPERIHKYLYPENKYEGPFDINRKGNLSFDIEDKPMSWEDRLIYASWLRAMLFKRVFNCYELDNELMCDFLKFDNKIEQIHELEKTVLSLKLRYGITFEQPNGKKACLDYAIRKGGALSNRHSYVRLLYGERELMYYCFLYCFNGNFTKNEQDLFYLYLLIKNQFRSELIQVNNEVGFANFAIYQRRKSSFWGDLEEYAVESHRLAVNASMSSGAIKSMELRMIPKQSPLDVINSVKIIDLAVQFAEKDTIPIFNGITPIYKLESEFSKMKAGVLLPYFYTLNFSKSKDTNINNNKIKNGLYCKYLPRNYKARKAAMNGAISISIALERSSYFCSRVRGIDAASFELGCRPETFATEFRYLRGFIPYYDRDVVKYQTRLLRPRIGITYHVGEDFLDIADGLRAVDETIRFLEYKRGDRIGHGLVLGVNPVEFYAMKNNMIVLSKQDMLDNLVWILMRTLELGIEIPVNTREILTSRCLRLFEEIYGDCCTQNGWDISLIDYYNSWKLRGDHPNCYINKCYSKFDDNMESLINFGASVSQYKHFYTYDNTLNVYRYDRKIAGLMYYYHFGYDEKRKGAAVETLEIDGTYISLMEKIQMKIRRLLAEKGISIECNLSSNQLIGTFRDYKKHPIFTFNNYGLTFNLNSEQLSASINTDDQGVFDTSLENEYAIIVQCMSEMRENGERIYSDDAIYSYIDHIRKQGLLQTFLPTDFVE